MSEPLITVLMSVYNGDKFLEKAIKSITTQTFSDFEFLIFDDCSTDNSWNILKSFQDQRIRLFKNQKNMGLTHNLNRGLDLARGEYVARMDADDVSFQNRLNRQKDFLQKNPEIAMVGCWAEVISEAGKKIDRVNSPILPYLLKWRLIFNNTFTHSGVMFRKEAACKVGGYSGALRYAQDYDLWSRISTRWEVANIPIVLVGWRRWKRSASSIHEMEQAAATRWIAKRNMAKVLEGEFDENRFKNLMLMYSKPNYQLRQKDISQLAYNVERLLYCFCTKYNYRDRVVKKAIRVEIATHGFRCILNSPCSIIDKKRLVLCWVGKVKPNPFRIFSVFFFRRTELGIRISRLLKSNSIMNNQ